MSYFLPRVTTEGQHDTYASLFAPAFLPCPPGGVQPPVDGERYRVRGRVSLRLSLRVQSADLDYGSDLAPVWLAEPERTGMRCWHVVSDGRLLGLAVGSTEDTVRNCVLSVILRCGDRT